MGCSNAIDCIVRYNAVNAVLSINSILYPMMQSVALLQMGCKVVPRLIEITEVHSLVIIHLCSRLGPNSSS